MWNLSRGWRSPVRYAVLLAVAVGAGSLTAGCQGGSTSPSPSVSASHSGTASPSASSSSSPSPSPSYSVPPEARTHDEAGAAAFLSYYLDTVNRAWTTPDPTLLPVLADSGCKSCSGLQEIAQELRDKQQRYEVNPLVVEQISASPGAPEGQQFLNVRIKEVGARVLDSKGSVVRTETPDTVERKAGVIWTEGRWLLYGIA